LLEKLAELQAEGLGEVEIHLHHGSNTGQCGQLPTDSGNLRDVLVQDHKCLSRRNASPGDVWILCTAISPCKLGRRQYCGVDSEMQILATPGATRISRCCRAHQPRFPASMRLRCGHPLEQRKPHRSDQISVSASLPPAGNLYRTSGFQLRRRVWVYRARLDDGVLQENYRRPGTPVSLARRPALACAGADWIFIKLYCHGFIPLDQAMAIGEPGPPFLEEALDTATEPENTRSISSRPARRLTSPWHVTGARRTGTLSRLPAPSLMRAESARAAPTASASRQLRSTEAGMP